MIADLSTVAGFASQYRDEFAASLDGVTNQLEAKNKIRELYVKKEKGASTPDIYKHRLKRVLCA